MNTNQNTKKRVLLTLCFILMLCGIGAMFTFISPQTTYAQGNTDISTFRGTENFSHMYLPSFLGKGEDYSENITTNTGIRFYSSANTGINYTGNSIKLDSTVFSIDFTNAKVSYPTANEAILMSYRDRKYSFDILNSSGSVVWYAEFQSFIRIETTGTGDTATTAYYYRNTVNVNGRITNSAEATNSACTKANLSLFGTPTVNLSSGSYSIRITRDYTWSQKKSSMWSYYEDYNTTSRIDGSLLIDNFAPSLSMRGYSTGNTISSGAYIKERASITAADINFDKLYYKTPSMPNYVLTNSKTYTVGTETGWYYFYSTDICNNKSETVSFYYDATAPTGKISSNGVSVLSGSYINGNFSYSSIDTASGVTQYYYKTPNSGDYQQYMPGMVINKMSGDGWYYFYSIDKCGNISAISSVFLETSTPLVGIYRNDNLAYSKTVTSSGTFETDIYFNEGDTFKITCDTSSGNVTSNYALNTTIKITNSFLDNFNIQLTTATGIASVYKVHIVRDLPKLVISGTEYNSGETLYFNENKTISWIYDSVITNPLSSGVFISSSGANNVNENILYSSGQKSFELISSNRAETCYYVNLSDAAGNETLYTIIIDQKAPEGEIISDGKTIENNGYTNKPVLLEFDEDIATAKYSVNGGEYLPYVAGKILSSDAVYKILLTDKAGNKTTYTVTLNTKAPTGQLYANFAIAESGAITNNKIYFTWDGQSTATVNGNVYTKNVLLSSDGTYNFILTDLAGNFTTYTITIDTTAPLYNANKLAANKTYKVSKWHNALINGETYSFASYADALAFACVKEFDSGVTSLTLNNIADFTQVHLVANNGDQNNHDDEVRTGEYWLYKSKANPNSLLYYFDKALLDETVAHYAKANVSSVNYYILGGDNSYGTPSENMQDNIWTAPDGTIALIANNAIFEKIDSREIYAEFMSGNGTKKQVSFGVPFTQQFSVGGLYRITEIDAAGNEAIYFVYLDLAAPTLNVSATIFGNTEPIEINITEEGLAGIAAYYYESFNIQAILDADKWSVLTVTNSGKTNYYTYGDKLPLLNIGGEYTLTVYDRLNNSYSFTVYIVGSPAQIVFDNNTDDTAFNLNITLEQNFDTIVTLEIRRNGFVVSGVSTDKLSYVFDKDGVYTVVLRDNFGRVIEHKYTFVKSLPVGTLTGVENGGKTKTNVTFTYDNTKYYVELFKSGTKILTDKSGGIQIIANDLNSGNYTLKLINLSDKLNYNEYTFVINTLAPTVELSGVKNNDTTNGKVTVSWGDKDIIKAIYTVNGTEVKELINGQILTDEGTYLVTVTNDLRIETTLTFTIDKSLDYYVSIGENIANALDSTNKTVAIFNNEPLSISVTLNRQPIDYTFGSVLTYEGVYSFRVTDEFGNLATFNVTIDKSVDYFMNVANGGIIGGDAYIANAEKLTVTMTKDGSIITYNFGEKLNDEGYYKATLRDTNGNEKTVEFLIANGVKKTFDYTLGSNVKVLLVTLNGEPINHENNHLNFTLDGEYAVTLESENLTYTFTLSIDNAAPSIVLEGVTNGGAADGVVTIDRPSEEATILVYFNGELIAYEFGQNLSEYGEYKVIVTDKAGNIAECNFTLKKLLNGNAIAFIFIVIFVFAGAAIAVVILRKKGKFGKNKQSKKPTENSSKTASK